MGSVILRWNRFFVARCYSLAINLWMSIGALQLKIRTISYQEKHTLLNVKFFLVNYTLHRYVTRSRKSGSWGAPFSKHARSLLIVRFIDLLHCIASLQSCYRGEKLIVCWKLITEFELRPVGRMLLLLYCIATFDLPTAKLHSYSLSERSTHRFIISYSSYTVPVDGTHRVYVSGSKTGIVRLLFA